jgi:hypothetical protein
MSSRAPASRDSNAKAKKVTHVHCFLHRYVTSSTMEAPRYVIVNQGETHVSSPAYWSPVHPSIGIPPAPTAIIVQPTTVVAPPPSRFSFSTPPRLHPRPCRLPPPEPLVIVTNHKSEMCTRRPCMLGTADCWFAHAPDELREDKQIYVVTRTRPGVCWSYAVHGSCAWKSTGRECKFQHTREGVAAVQVPETSAFACAKPTPDATYIMHC